MCTLISGGHAQTCSPGRVEDESDDDPLINRKYGLPAECFAYVCDPLRPTTWKLPYRLIDGSPDPKRLPGAINAVVANYKGSNVDIPETVIPGVLVLLGRAAWELGSMPGQSSRKTADCYKKLHDSLHQHGRLYDIEQDSAPGGR